MNNVLNLIIAVVVCSSHLLVKGEEVLDGGSNAAFFELSRQSETVALVAEFRKTFVPPDSSKNLRKGMIKFEAKVVASIKGDLKVGEILSYNFYVEGWPKWLDLQSVPLNSDLYLLAFDLSSAVRGEPREIRIGDAVTRTMFDELLYKRLSAIP